MTFSPHTRYSVLGGCLRLVVMGVILAVPAVSDAEPAPLPRLLEITWKRGPNLPQGFQDSQGDIIDGHLISVGGFCSGETGVPGKPNSYPRGFLKKTWALELARPERGWLELPDFPGDARQGMQAIAVGDKLFCWGGFSYSQPYCYRDGYALSRTSRTWKWTQLPPLPTAVTAGGMCAVGSKIYLCGGADYDATMFYTNGNRAGKHARLGAQLWAIDTNNLEAGWQDLPACPGVPRWVHAMAAVGGDLYVLGGATGSDNEAKTYLTVVDNWRFNIAKKTWTRLADLPVASGNFPSGAIVYDERYILLVGGYQYSQIMNPDGMLRPVYGKPTRHYEDNPMCSDIFVYDTKTQSFGTASPMPLNNNLPMTVLRSDRLHLIGGEAQHAVVDGEHYGHHPDLYLMGEIRAAQ